MLLPPEFLDLMNGNQPAALIILSHYVVLLHHFEQGLWFLQGWSKGVIAGVGTAMDKEWKQWIEWPAS